MELFEAIDRRHSYRGPFLDEQLNRDDLRKIVQAGLKAPSGVNAQTTEFVILDEPETIREIGGMHEKNQAMRQAKAMILCLIDREPEPVYGDLSFQVEDCAAAVENMLLAVTALGLGSVWIDGWLRRENRAEKIAELVGIPPNKVIRILLPLGKPAEEGPRKEKKKFSERACFNRYKL